ncbi:MAG TPA: glycosyltransferase, partial [Caldithrix sp.]|nr:glycosyltransferase [Caldithrix sp.]
IIMSENIVISVIIVNYNVREFLEQALISVKKALKNISSEIIVVDNASIDGSVTMLKQRFPNVKLIESNHNLGFSAGNNLAIHKARGEFIVLLNPDTVVQEDTFHVLLDFFEKTPDASAATCKIINPDGSFSVDCRHSIPTPLTAFWKLLGLNRLFPKSRIFGRYNLTYLDENEINQVEAISGSFMMIKRGIIEKVGYLDEDFFMYCEDIDYCHRINKEGGKIYYVPASQIIHYKGESTKKNNLDYVITFNRSLYKFYKKHYQQKYIYPFKWLIILGTIFRGISIYLQNKIKLFYPIVLDLFLLNLIMLGSFYIRFEMRHGFTFDDFFSQYIVIHIITSIAFFLSALFFESVTKDRHSISKIIKSIFSAYLFVAALTFFFKMFAFSRLVVLISAISTSLFMIGWRLLFRIFAKKPSGILKRDFLSKRAIIVGFDDETKQLIDKLEGLTPTGIDLVGVVSDREADIGKKLGQFSVLTSVDKLPQYIQMQKVDLVIFTTHSISFQTILTTMSHVRNSRVEYKMVPGHLEFMIGKSVVERLDTIPLVDIEYAYGKLFNIFVKRVFDTLVSFILLVLLSPIFFILLPFKLSNFKKVQIFYNNGESEYIL